MGTERPDLGRLLFGRTRRDLLALLMGRPDERFYLREIVRVTGAGVGAVQRELKQLVHGGLITRAAVGRQVFFAANPDSPIFEELRSIIKKTAGVPDVLRDVLQPLLVEPLISLALIYGSVASNRERAASDVDLLVVGEVTLAKLIPLLREAEKRLSREINPSIYPVPELRAKVKAGAPFLKRVLQGPKLFIAGDAHVLERLAH